MSIETAENLVESWLIAKENERHAIEERRRIEDEMTANPYIYQPMLTGTKTTAIGGHEIKVITRINQKINSEMLYEIAAVNGIDVRNSRLFRWTPAINKRIWGSASHDETSIFAEAITDTPARVTYQITDKKEDKT